MFGFVKIGKPELRIKEYEMYKAIYCSLCKYLGKEYGIVARMMLNYDYTFLAMLIMAQADGFEGISRRRCVCNPIKKCNYCNNCNSEMTMPAAALVILAWHKNLDNISDEKGIKRLLSAVLKPLLRHSFNKAKKNYPDIADISKKYIDEQTALEKTDCSDIDAACEPSGRLLAQLFGFCAVECNKRAAYELGKNMGKWIYLCDAVSDYSDDLKKGRYNPFRNSDNIKERAKVNMRFYLKNAQSAFELLEIKKFKNILGNILYVGMEDVTDKELETL